MFEVRPVRSWLSGCKHVPIKASTGMVKRRSRMVLWAPTVLTESVNILFASSALVVMIVDPLSLKNRAVLPKMRDSVAIQNG